MAAEITSVERQLIARLRESSGAIEAFFESHRAELKRLVNLRIDRRLKRRLDASDILQEAYLYYHRKIADYLRAPHKRPVPWLRYLVRRVLGRVQRAHTEIQARDVAREVNIEVLNIELDQLADSFSSVGSPLHRQELRKCIAELLGKMSTLDREILTLVHIEGKKLSVAAEELDVPFETAKKRYRRALNRVRERTQGNETLELYESA